MSIEVALVEPEIPQNTGNVARTCAAVGANLHLVHPLGFEISDRAVRRAGLDYWKQLTVIEHKSIREFINWSAGRVLVFFSARGSLAHSSARYGPDPILVFGKETKGLPAWVLDGDFGTVVRIPMQPGARCLNLSNSVAVGVYEAMRQAGYPGLADFRADPPELKPTVSEMKPNQMR